MVLKHGDLVTGAHQQTSARWRILGNIEPCPLTVSQIARLTGYTRQSIQRLADSLVDEGLATYESAIDRRTKNICITEKGKEILEKLAEYENEWVARITQTLSVEELTDLAVALEKVRAVLAEDYVYRRQRQKE
jgi:DNA-binding MarR family transcriptional regulator